VSHEKKIGKQRRRRAFSVRNRIKRDSTRVRLSVFRSHKHIYAQVIDDEMGKTLASASTQDANLREKLASGGNKAAAEAVGKAVAERAIEAGVKIATFDRREYKYHGRLAALADAARYAGLDLGPNKLEPALEEPKDKKKKNPGPKKASGAKKQ
jgi:large subunit ribosomal protein L18